MTDILKIQKAVRKAIKDYTIESKREEEVLVAFLSVDIYLALEDHPEPIKARKVTPNLPVITHEAE